MQADYQKVVSGAAKKPLTCVRRGQVQVDFGIVEVDYGSIEVQQASFGMVRSRVKSDISTVQEDIRQAQTAWGDLEAAVAANTTGSPPPQFTKEEIDQAIRTATEAIDATTKTTMQAQDQTGAIDK